MSTTKVYSKREVEKILKENGWEFVHTRGSHRKFYNIKLNDTVVIPSSNNKMLIQRTLKERGLI